MSIIIIWVFKTLSSGKNIMGTTAILLFDQRITQQDGSHVCYGAKDLWLVR